MKKSSIKSLYDTEVAMMEHELISENEVLEWRPEDLQFYLSGVHEMAQKVIEKIREKEVF